MEPSHSIFFLATHLEGVTMNPGHRWPSCQLAGLVSTIFLLLRAVPPQVLGPASPILSTAMISREAGVPGIARVPREGTRLIIRPGGPGLKGAGQKAT